MSANEIPKALCHVPRMEVTREEFERALDMGIKKYGSISAFEREADLRHQYVKDTRIQERTGKAKTFLPSANDWNKIKKAIGWEEDKLTPAVDEELMTRAYLLVERAARKMNIKLNTAQAMACTVRLYNHVREFGEEPTESSASLILKTAAHT